MLILELLKLYDRRKDTTILDVVIQLLDFLSEKDSSQVDLYQINRLQTEKRRRKLNPEEIQYLSSMKTKGIPAQYQLAANILLESFYEAQLIYDQLCPEEKEVFVSLSVRLPNDKSFWTWSFFNVASARRRADKRFETSSSVCP